MEQLINHLPQWAALSSKSPEPVVACHCALARNVRDFVFPECCIDDERRAVEARVLELLKANTAIPEGVYFPVGTMDAVAARFLAERRLITYEMLCASGPRGVYVAEGQSLGIMMNTTDHIVIRAIAPGDNVTAAWNAANEVDNTLGGMLDYSYHDRLGYLTKSLRMTGTGLRMGVLLHLPGLVMMRRLQNVEASMGNQHLQLCGMMLGDPRVATSPTVNDFPVPAYGLTAAIEGAACQCLYMDMLGALAVPTANTAGNLFLLTNQDTLGLSEPEIVFQVEQAVAEIVSREEEARQQLMHKRGDMLLDSIGRALGIARSARQIGMGEALLLASLMRLAATQGCMTGLDRAALNRLLLECQGAHLQLMLGVAPDAKALAGARADLFRALFSGAAIN